MVVVRRPDKWRSIHLSLNFLLLFLLKEKVNEPCIKAKSKSSKSPQINIGIISNIQTPCLSPYTRITSNNRIIQHYIKQI
jgi:hypothetical protein